jgi:DNA-binding transcriptional LysR family regulator
LERSLGKPLFDRTAQGVIPTKTGETLARELRRALREIEMARGEVMLAAGHESLEVTVGALPMAGSHDLALATHKFMSEFPHAKVRLFSGEYHKLLADLSNSRIDMIFGVLRKPDWAEDLGEDLLFEDSYCLVMRPDHPLLRLSEPTPEALALQDWIVPQTGTPRRKRIEAIFEGCPNRPRFQVETPSLALIRAFLVNTDTITLMARSEVQADIDQGILAALPCPGPETILRKGVTTRADWLPTEAHIAFLNCLREVTQGSRPGAERLAG